MHSFHHSRGRILFEVLCALAIAASLTGAWMQTGASALLAAAGVAALYGFVHLFDLRRQKPAEAVPPQLIEADEEPQGDLLAFAANAPEPTADPAPEVAGPTEISEPVEPASPPAKAGRRAKAPRKGGGRRASASKAAEVTEPAPPVGADVTAVVPSEEPATVVPLTFDETAHPPLAPLFEPEPFVRQQRTVFGRKAG